MDKNISDAKCIEKLQELSRTLRQASSDMLHERQAERLITEAAIKDLAFVGSCKTCGNRSPFCDTNPDSCDGYVWRGADPKSLKEIKDPIPASAPISQDLLQDAKTLIGQLTEALEKGAVPEKKAEEKSYLDMVTDLHAALESDTSLPSMEKQTVIHSLQLVKTILWKHSA